MYQTVTECQVGRTVESPCFTLQQLLSHQKMLASIRSTLPLKNFDVVERTVLGGNLDPKFIRAINTGVFYPEITSDADVRFILHAKSTEFSLWRQCL